MNASGPDSVIAGARPSSRCGRSASSVVSSCSVWPSHSPRPRQRPAGPVRPLLLPSSMSMSLSSSLLRSAASPFTSRAMRRTGSRPSSQRPGSVLSMSTDAVIGASRSGQSTFTSPDRRVCGAAPDSTERSSAWVVALSAASGQAAKGSKLALTSAAGAGDLAFAGAGPRSVVSSAMRSSVPLARAVTAKAPSPASGSACSCAVSA